MKKILSLLMILCVLFSYAFAEDQPDDAGKPNSTPVYTIAENNVSNGTLTLAFKGNPTTGYVWTAAILGGEAIVLDETESIYVSDDAQPGMAGVGGTFYFKLKALRAGESVLRFQYARSWEQEAIEGTHLLATVDDKLSITVQEIPEDRILNGIVTTVKPNEHSIDIYTTGLEMDDLLFSKGLMLPEKNEQITIFLNNDSKAIAWENLSARLGIEPVTELPEYLYEGDDPIEEAVAYETSRLGGGLTLELNVNIPAPAILKVEKQNETSAKVYGNFCEYNYTVIGNVLVTVSGANHPGYMELSCDGEKWKVTNVVIAEDGEEMGEEIDRFCQGDQELMKAYADDKLMDAARLRFVSQYVKTHQLPIVAYQDPFWEPIPLKND